MQMSIKLNWISKMSEKKDVVLNCICHLVRHLQKSHFVCVCVTQKNISTKHTRFETWAIYSNCSIFHVYYFHFIPKIIVTIDNWPLWFPCFTAQCKTKLDASIHCRNNFPFNVQGKNLFAKTMQRPFRQNEKSHAITTIAKKKRQQLKNVLFLVYANIHLFLLGIHP